MTSLAETLSRISTAAYQAGASAADESANGASATGRTGPAMPVPARTAQRTAPRRGRGRGDGRGRVQGGLGLPDRPWLFGPVQLPGAGATWRTVSAMFDVAGEAYDRFMGRYSRLLSPQLADLAGVVPGQRVLDVGCGPGALTAELVARLGADAVTAVDPSEPFVGAVRVRHPGVDVRQAPAEALPFADASFDAALAQLVVHFMTDPAAGLAEMVRVTRAGGVVAACVWDHAGGLGPLGLFWDTARTLDPEVTDESNLAGAREGHLAELLKAAGLRDVTETSLTADLEHPSFDDWWAPFTQGVGPAGALRDEPRFGAPGRVARALPGPPAERPVRDPGAGVGSARRRGLKGLPPDRCPQPMNRSTPGPPAPTISTTT